MIRPVHQIRTLVIGLLAGLAFLWQSVPAGAVISERLVPILTTYDQQRVRSAVLTGGDIVFVWEDHSGSNATIHYRLFNPGNNQFGPVRTAHVGSIADHTDPAVTGLAGGGFVVAFASTATVNGDHDVRFQIFDSTGVRLGTTDFPGSATTDFDQLNPEVAPVGNGFVVVFADQSPSDQEMVFRRFDALGNPQDSTNRPANGAGLNAVVNGDQGAHKVASLGANGFAITYEDRANENVHGVRFDLGGAALDVPEAAPGTKQFLLSTNSNGLQSTPYVAGYANGGFVVTFNHETDGLPQSRRVLGRVFDRDGRSGDVFGIGSHPGRWQDARVAAFNEGFVASWQAREVPATWSVHAQTFSLKGDPVVMPFRVNVSTNDHRDRPAVVALPAGAIAVAWEALNQDGSGEGIYARMLAAIQPSQGLLGITRLPGAGGGSVRLRFEGPPAECYALQGSFDFAAWNQLLITNSLSGIFEHQVPVTSIPSYRFYRVERKLTP